MTHEDIDWEREEYLEKLQKSWINIKTSLEQHIEKHGMEKEIDMINDIVEDKILELQQIRRWFGE